MKATSAAGPHPHGVVPRFVALAIAVVTAALLGVGVAATPASAHAVLESTTPVQGSQVNVLPKAVTLTFGEAVTIDAGSVRVVGPSGARVDDGAVVHPNGAAAKVAVGLRSNLPVGSYTVVWRVVSADSHPVSGTFSFGYGVAAGAVADVGNHGSKAVGVMNGIARFVGYAGLALVFGVFAFAVLVSRRVWDLKQVRRLFGLGSGLLALSGLALLLLAGPYDEGTGIGDVFSGSLLQATVETKYGKLMLVRVLVAALAAVSAYLLVDGQNSSGRRRPRLDALALVVVGVLTFALAGHSGTGFQVALAAAMDSVHLLAVSAWVGGLVVLGGILIRRQELATLPLASFLPRWSRLAIACVALIVATGAYQSWREVGTFPAFPTTAYGRLLLVKIGLLVVLVGLGAFGRRWVLRIAHGPRGLAPPQVSLRRSVGAETILSVGVIGVAAVLVNVQPARDTYNPSWSATVSATGLVPSDAIRVHVGSSSTRPGLTTIHVDAVSSLGKPLPYQQVAGLLTEPARGLGPVRFTLPMSKTGHGETNVVVPESGRWQLAVQVRVGDTADYAASTSYLVR